MGFNKWNTNFRLEHPVRKKELPFPDVLFLSEIFHWNDILFIIS